MRGGLSIVKFLTEEIKKYEPMKDLMPSLTTMNKKTPLHSAALNGHYEIVQLFINDLNSSPNIPGQSGHHPLHDPSCLDRGKQTPLNRTAHNGHLGIVKFLTLEKHYNPNQRDIQQNTPLYTAAGKGHLQVVQFFVEDLKCPPNIRV